ncbi:Caffeic acid 3-O-methyltransferase isoform B [Glycine soja]|uniref:Caffeic acid 3-O-methyltransferase isoform B n=1 Tax=Glycine soja TaxID=3848 RepID=A0A445IAN6_GLYSO|nr:Caffeic acid 3-O-methyltransferase isoform B [Glycine soja]
MEKEESTEQRKQARLAIMELANMISVPMALNAVVRLNVADAIWQGGANNPLSAAEILPRLLPAGGGDAENLQRLLRMLASYGVFYEHLSAGERKYSLTDVGKTLVTDEQGLSYAHYVLQHHQDALMRAWPMVHEAVVDPTKEPFERANGEPAYGYYLKHPEMNDLMVRAMSGVSVPFIRAMLEGYDGFQGVEKLVDVGGSGGDCLRMILEKHPTIKEGINFDLPEVVAKAPQIPFVTHVGGDMFKFIPQGDAIFMKVSHYSISAKYSLLYEILLDSF